MQNALQPFVPWLLAATAFFIGSIPFGLLIARIFHVKDLRNQGSGNIGATNVARVAGFWPAGFLTFALDVLKGVLPVFLALPGGLHLWSSAVGLDIPELQPWQPWLVGLMAVLGHCYCPWLRFKGGKGVATGFGVLLLLSPVAALAGIAAFGLTFVSRRLGSLSSLVGLVTAAALHLVLHPTGSYVPYGFLLIFVIALRHEVNIDALLANRESHF